MAEGLSFAEGRSHAKGSRCAPLCVNWMNCARSFWLDYVRYPEGSVLIALGDTKVLCNATVEETLPRWLKYGPGKKHGWITAEYAMLPRSTQVRTQRETLTPKGRTQEIKRLIAQPMAPRTWTSWANGRSSSIATCCRLTAARTASITGSMWRWRWRSNV